MAKFDYLGAVEAGWSDNQISAYLNKKRSEGEDIYIDKTDFESLHQVKQQGLLQKIGSKLGSVFSEVATKVGEAAKAGETKAKTGSLLERAIAGPEAALRAVGAVAGGVGELAGSAAIGSGKALLPKSAEEGIAKSFQEQMSQSNIPSLVESYNSWAEKHPEASKDLESVANIASLLPVGGGVKVGAEVSGSAIKGAGVVAGATGRVLKGSGEELIQKVITPTVQEAERLLNYEAKVPFLKRFGETIKGTANKLKPSTRATTATEKGIAGTEKMVGVQAKREADRLWNKTIAPAVDASEAVVSKGELFKPIEERIASTLEPGKKTAYEEAFAAIQDDYKDVTNFSLKDAQKVKRELDEFTPDKVFKGKSVANEYATLKNDMANAIREKTYEALSEKNIKQAYLDWGNLFELQKIGVKAISGAGKKGGFGGFWTSMWDSLVTPAGTVGGKVLYKVGDKLEFVGEKGIKKFGDFLKSKGFQP